MAIPMGLVDDDRDTEQARSSSPADLTPNSVSAAGGRPSAGHEKERFDVRAVPVRVRRAAERRLRSREAV